MNLEGWCGGQHLVLRAACHPVPCLARPACGRRCFPVWPPSRWVARKRVSSLWGFNSAENDQQILRAYQWIAGKLAQQKAPPQADALPVWVWHTHNPGHAEPDLWRLRPYAPGVLLELEVDAARVLLSDFDLWHAPLNGTFLGTEEEDMAFDQQYEQRGVEGWNTFWHDSELAKAALVSWDHCLDLDWYAPNWFGEARERKKIQGVMWEIRPEDVMRHRPYQGWKWRRGE
ncbi:DUF3841 domain-containing protein [Deinococcus cavernae]|uniref:DUF3841 domain-containing protein n=1 Tax=Deinococcus cavernae TaxID=2320857 RepID=A0A418VHY5_9DEIO|nr:DUF3841 domain-containing protein [Deinococcus cavernae]RJF75655.1 DUF3841 domain-containing protein [Deinococcus cavernae]